MANDFSLGWLGVTDDKKRVEQALLNFHKRDLREIKKLSGRGKKNKSPEREVAMACVSWLESNGFIGNIYESKATYDPRRGVYRQQAMKAGHADWAGVDSSGIAAAVEFKAPGKLSTFNIDKNFLQRQFIINRISIGSFACVVDSASLLSSIYSHWLSLSDRDERIKYLMSMLP